MPAKSTYTDEIAAEICSRVISGRSLDSIGEDQDMPSVSCIYSWLRKYPLFEAEYARARDIRSDRLGNEIIRIADTEPDPQKARNMIDARKWVAARMTPRKWGDRVEVEHSGTVNHAPVINVNVVAAKQEPIPIDVGPTKQALPPDHKICGE